MHQDRVLPVIDFDTKRTVERIHQKGKIFIGLDRCRCVRRI